MPAVSFGRLGMRARTSRIDSRRLAPERVELGVALEVLVDALHLRAHVRLEPERLHHLQAGEPVEDDRIIRRPEANDLHDPRDGSHLEEVAETGLVYVGVPLADDADDGAVLAEEILDQADAAGTTHVDGDHAGGEDDAVSEREKRKGLKLGGAGLDGHDRAA